MVRNVRRVDRLLVELGEHASAWRKIQGFTQADLAYRAGVTRQTISKIENGRGHSVGVANLLSVLWVLGVDSAMLDSLDPINDEAARLRIAKADRKRVRT